MGETNFEMDHSNLQFCQKTANRIYNSKDFWWYNESDSDWDSIQSVSSNFGHKYQVSTHFSLTFPAPEIHFSLTSQPPWIKVEKI